MSGHVPDPDSDPDTDAKTDSPSPVAVKAEGAKHGKAEPPAPPTLEEVLAFSAQNALGLPEMATVFFCDYEARPLSPGGLWTMKDGVEVRDWRRALRSFSIRWRANEHERQQGRQSRQQQPQRTKPDDNAEF